MLRSKCCPVAFTTALHERLKFPLGHPIFYDLSYCRLRSDSRLCIYFQEILAFACKRFWHLPAFPADFGICPHLPARLRLSYRFLCSGQHTYSNNSDKLENAVIVVTLPAGVEMLSSLHQRTMFGDEIGVRDGAPLMDRTHPCLVALAAASHWPPHMRMCSTCFKFGSDPCVIFALNKQPTQYWNAWR